MGILSVVSFFCCNSSDGVFCKAKAMKSADTPKTTFNCSETARTTFNFFGTARALLNCFGIARAAFFLYNCLWRGKSNFELF